MNGSLPVGWALAKLGGLLLEAQNGCGVRGGEGTPTVVLRLADVDTDGTIATEGLRVTGLRSSDVEKYALRQGDLLVFRVNGSRDIAGQVIRYNGPAGFTYCDHFIRLRVDSTVVDPDFVARAFRNGTIRRQVELAMVSSAGQNTVSQGSFRDIEIPIPPLNEQRRIVAKLEALKSRSRRAHEALDAVPAILEKLRQSILAAAFRGDLTRDWRARNPNPEPAAALLARIRTERRKTWEAAELAKFEAKGKRPKDDRWRGEYPTPTAADVGALPVLPTNWCWATVGELFHVAYGLSEALSGVPRQPIDGHVAVLRIPNIAPNGTLDLDDLRYFPLAPDARESLLLRRGDVLFNWRNAPGWIGKSAVFDSDEPFVNASFLLRLRPPALGYSDFVAMYFNHLRVSGFFLTRVTNAVNQANFNGSLTAAVPIPLPPLAEQAAIAQMLVGRTRRLAVLRDSTMERLASLAQLERSVLAKAFRGELVVQDSNDEPADVMLARLRNQVSTEAPRKRGGRRQAAE